MAKKQSTTRKIGYKKPPSTSQFKPGQSGNPNGRPKNSKNFVKAVQKELDSPVAIIEHSKRRTISKQDAVIKQLVNKAATGDPRAIALLLKALGSEERSGADHAAEGAWMVENDQIVIADIVRRIRLMDDPDATPPAPPDQQPAAQPTT